ncbi:hypothetical protein J4410_04420 [Candidatus Woesearchaeota archaeon]|nr:hypothetical protein [Candidatus Woesearchaeota archaeon]
MTYSLNKFMPYLLGLFLILSILIPFFSISVYKEFRWDVETNLLYSAFQETQGKHVYADYFNSHQKTPGMIWLLTPFVSFFGGSFTSLLVARFVTILFKTATAFLLYSIAVRIFHKKEIGLLTIFIYIITNIVNSFSGIVFVDAVHTFFEVLAVLLYLKRGRYYLVSSFFFVGVAILFHPKSFILLPVLFIVECFHMPTLKSFFQKSFQCVLGVVLGLLPLFVYLFKTHTFKTFYYMVGVFNKFNPLIFPSLQLKVFRTITHLLFDMYLIPLVLLAYFFFFRSEKFSSFKKPCFLIFLWVVVLHLFFLMSKGYYASYYYQVMPAIALLAAYGAYELYQHISFKKTAASLFIIFLILIMTVNFFNPITNLTGEREKYVHEYLVGQGHSNILTRYASDLFLLEQDNDFHYGVKQEESYLLAELDTVFKDRSEFRNVQSYVQQHNVTAFLLDARVPSDPIFHNQSSYLFSHFKEVCLPDTYRPNAFDNWYEKLKSIFGQPTPIQTSCRNFLHVRSN